MLRSVLNSRLSFALLVSLVVAGCGMTRNMGGLDFADHDGRLFVGGVPVDYHREVSLLGEMLDDDLVLMLQSHTGPIDVVGGPGDTYELVIDFYTEFENDGGVQMDGGRLEAWSDLDGAVVINGIRGRLPEGVALEALTGTGDVLFTSFLSNRSLKLKSGTGAVVVNSCEVDRITIDLGTGDARMTECTTNSVRTKLGVGSLAVTDCVIADFQGDSGTGDFFFQNSRLDNASFVSGVGDVRLTNTLVSELRSSLGTGRVEQKSTVTDD